MAPRAESPCRLCGCLVPVGDLRQALCPVCDEYAQRVALQIGKTLELVVGELQNVPLFRAALRESH